MTKRRRRRRRRRRRMEIEKDSYFDPKNRVFSVCNFFVFNALFGVDINC
jgi:hypothetical protein